MATRYKVVRKNVRFCKQTYHKGEFLPESFSERDLYRVLYPSRIEKVEISDVAEPENKAATSTQGVNPAKAKPAAPTKTHGASLSGTSIKK